MRCVCPLEEPAWRCAGESDESQALRLDLDQERAGGALTEYGVRSFREDKLERKSTGT